MKEMDWYSLKMCTNKIHGIYKLFTCSKVYNRKLKDITSNYMLFQEKSMFMLSLHIHVSACIHIFHTQNSGGRYFMRILEDTNEIQNGRNVM